MPTIKSRQTTFSGNVQSRVETSATDDRILVPPAIEKAERQKAWETMKDHTLLEWGRNPGLFADEDFEPPSQTAIGTAWELANDYSDSEKPAPTRVVPDGEGGLVFEHRDEPIFETVEFAKDGSAELLIFYNSKLQQRHPLISV